MKNVMRHVILSADIVSPLSRLLMKCLISLLLMLGSTQAMADSFYVLVGFVCDSKTDELRITYDGAYNEEGKAMFAGKTKTQWDPWQLVMAKDDDHIGSLKTVNARCRLTDGVYKIELKPAPGNFNVQGRCDAWMTAGAKVTKNGKAIYSIDRFDNDCHDTESPIVTRVKIRPNTEPVLVTVKWDDFYK